ncbi:chemotaxis protein [Sphingobium jiangsuense]|uniref:Methyl-accepting chemotaxis protein n=1 Tax=Sphingobium jiangsuense TaxID=870476 RepID=A0A7W6BKF9_9SPHN|nr:methyl-accepting chemotaxis protein [Sphingobium jiangsuense]MBB3925330.1 methyl-accepting chemotaxis protein [Sphingobium jiangsuense]GLS99266.1 chemotaxis protein [Sphingobium jiangsuense]
MSNRQRAGLAGWLESKSINQRLTIQVVAAIVASLCLVTTITIGSFVSLQYSKRNAALSERALQAALLEKDFTSLQRDVFRHGLLRTDETRQGYEGNIGDLKESISQTRKLLDAGHADQLGQVVNGSDAYIGVVNGVLAGDAMDAAGEARISAAGDEVDSAIENLRKPAVAEAAAMTELQQRTVLIIMALTIAIAAVTGIGSLLLASRVKRAIGQEIESLSDAIARIADGDLGVHIDYTHREDQLGALARAADKLRETSRAKQQSDRELADMADKVSSSLRSMAEGDLTVRLSDLGANYVRLQQDFNSAIAQLHDTIASVSEAATDIRSGAKEISQASDDLASRTEQHAAELAHAAEAVDQITGSLHETATVATQANQGVLEAVAEARNGGDVVGKAVHAMTNIERSSAEIGQIINVIDGIAFQTNLLALNAGVEAARAGDAGKGFAVVASEVRALAQRSAEAAKDIKALITTSSAEVEEGALMVRQVGEALEQITDRIHGITTMVTQISSAAAAQSAKLAEVNGAMGKMDQVTQQNAAMVEESTAAARSLLQEADGLTDRVGRFVCQNAARPPRASASAPTSLAAPAKARPAPGPMPLTSGNLALAAPAPQDEDDWSEF